MPLTRSLPQTSRSDDSLLRNTNVRKFAELPATQTLQNQISSQLVFYFVTHLLHSACNTFKPPSASASPPYAEPAPPRRDKSAISSAAARAACSSATYR